MGGDRYEYYDFWPDKFGWRGQHSVAEKFHALLAQAFDRHIASQPSPLIQKYHQLAQPRLSAYSFELWQAPAEADAVPRREGRCTRMSVCRIS